MRSILPYVQRHWTALALLLAGLLLPLVLTAKLTEDVFRDGGFAWDRATLQWYAAHRTPGLTRWAKGLAVVGGLWVLPWIVLAVAAGLRQMGARAHAAFLLLAVGGAALLNGLAKITFQRPRPDALVAALTEPGFSFPSGHTMTNAAFGLALAFVFWRSRAGWPLAVLGIVWAVAVGVSRNYLGVHYPTDVLAGLLSSTAWVVGLYLILRRRWPSIRQSPSRAERAGQPESGPAGPGPQGRAHEPVDRAG